MRAGCRVRGDFIARHPKNNYFRYAFTINEAMAGMSLPLPPRYRSALYPARAWITEIDRRDIAKVRDFTIIIDEGRIINAVIAVERVHVTTRVTVVLLLGRFDTDT